VRSSSTSRQPGRHAILTAGRSGSNFLVNTLNQHPLLVNYGETLGDWTMGARWKRWLAPGMAWDRYLDCVVSGRGIFYLGQRHTVRSHRRRGVERSPKAFNDVSSIGIKDFSFLFRHRGITDYFVSRPDYKVIYLYRRNLLKRFVSLINMQASGQPVTYVGGTAKAVEVDVPRMLEAFKVYRDEEELERRILASLAPSQVMHLEYEQYFASPQQTMEANQQVFDFLGVPQLELLSDQKKSGRDRLEDAIVNIDDVRRALAGTPEEAFLY